MGSTAPFLSRTTAEMKKKTHDSREGSEAGGKILEFTDSTKRPKHNEERGER
jgi:hypothetical protein